MLIRTALQECQDFIQATLQEVSSGHRKLAQTNLLKSVLGAITNFENMECTQQSEGCSPKGCNNEAGTDATGRWKYHPTNPKYTTPCKQPVCVRLLFGQLSSTKSFYPLSY